MDLKTLKEESEIITNKIIKKDSDLYRNIEPVIDGIVSIEEYIKTHPKILWVLKEPYDEADGTGGGWQLVRDFPKDDQDNYIFGNSSSTWHPIIYICYGILNNYRVFNEMPEITANSKMHQILNKIAVINIKKTPGQTATDYKSLDEAFKANKDILFKQIETYDPDIIIGGNTLGYFFNEMGILLNQFTDSDPVYYYKKDGKLFINAYHTAQRNTVDKDLYVNEIISAVKNKF